MVKEKKMIYILAFASSDGVNVNEHFGAARSFTIAELDTDKEDCEITEQRDVTPACHGGEHEVSGFANTLKVLAGTDVIVAQRAGPGAKKYIQEQGIKVYEIPLTIEQAVCLLMEDKCWEVDKWQFHTKN